MSGQRNIKPALTEVPSADDERRQAKRNSLADRLVAKAKALADLKIEKAVVEGERRTVEADLGPVRGLAHTTSHPVSPSALAGTLNSAAAFSIAVASSGASTSP
jgi:hypothetical protein